jgi:hypothetical protein
VTDSEIDDAVIASVGPRWDKVAVIVTIAAEKLYGKSAAGYDEHKVIAARIEILVENGRLEAQGDITRWRFSEIRLPRGPRRGES